MDIFYIFFDFVHRNFASIKPIIIKRIKSYIKIEENYENETECITSA